MLSSSSKGFRIYLPFQTRSRVERHVVIEKLTEERHPRRERGVVRIVDVQRRVEDQIPREIWIGDYIHLVGRIHDAAHLAQLLQRIPHRRRIGGKRRQHGKHAPELTLLIVGGSGRVLAAECVVTMPRHRVSPFNELVPEETTAIRWVYRPCLPSRS